MRDLMLTSEHRAALKAVQDRYDLVMDRTKWDHRIAGFICGAGFGIFATVATIFALLSA